MVKRYDRVEQQGRWRRLHQEDFCQALGKPPSAKYESNQTGIPGPTLADMFAVTRNAMQAPDITACSTTWCSTSSRATPMRTPKNYSMMISGRGFKLSPIYDVMCAEAWEHVTRNMAQKIARQEPRRASEAAALAALCSRRGAQCAAPHRACRDAARNTLAETGNAAADVAAMPAGAHPLMETVTAAIEKRARALLSGLSRRCRRRGGSARRRRRGPCLPRGRRVSKPKAARPA